MYYAKEACATCTLWFCGLRMLLTSRNMLIQMCKRAVLYFFYLVYREVTFNFIHLQCPLLRWMLIMDVFIDLIPLVPLISVLGSFYSFYCKTSHKTSNVPQHMLPRHTNTRTGTHAYAHLYHSIFPLHHLEPHLWSLVSEA